LCVYAGNSVEFDTAASTAYKSQPFEIKTEDTTEHDDKPAPYVCTVCDKRFTRTYHLKYHKLAHTVGNVYSCSEWEDRFSSQKAPNKHKNIHTGKYRCTECGRCCGSSYDLSRHRQIHSGEKPFQCIVCTKRFAQAGSLVVHNRIHSGEKPYKCHMCDKAFSQSAHLYTHMKVHTGDKPYNRPYHCPYCEMLFNTNMDLKCHVRIHTDAKPYSCRHCSERFTTHYQFKTHMLKSHNEGT